MSDGTAGFFTILLILLIGAQPNNEQQAVEAMVNCRAINSEPQALYDCMNYQGFQVQKPGQLVTEVGNYVPMYGWQHGYLKRYLDAVTGWLQ